MGSNFTIDRLLQKLTDGAVKRWQEKFTAEILEECGGMCVLVCRDCDEFFSAKYLAQISKTHSASCKGKQKQQQGSSSMHAAQDDALDTPSPEQEAQNW